MDDARLRQFFKFNESDLRANRNGRLSENQGKRVKDEARAERKSARDSMMILLVIAALGLAFGLIIVINVSLPSARILIGGLLCLLWPLGWGWKAWQAMRSAPPEREEQVRAARGRVRVLRYDEDVILEVGERQFDLEKNPSGVIADGDEVIVYYLERTEEILSVEKA